MEDIKNRLDFARSGTEIAGKAPYSVGRYIAGCGGSIERRINMAALVAEALDLSGDDSAAFAQGLAEVLAPEAARLAAN